MQPNDTIWSVSALNFEIRTMLEQGIGSIWIEGEVSNFACPASGHWYFSLKDERAQCRAAMFKGRNSRVGFRPQDGQQVLLQAKVTLYEARGEFQLVVEHMEEAGVGRLMRQFEALKKQLSGEGLFAQDAKQPIPAQARHIGIITSASGAAIRDALSVIRRRSPSSEVTVFPTMVQGDEAVAHIVAAIDLANRHGQSDVLLLIRGGGSLEDLWCFNEEAVARAIFASKIPIVSGVGHEIDTTIADFVADFRAPTPSVAAETVTMDQYEMMSRIDNLSARLRSVYLQQLQLQEDRVIKLVERLRVFHPQRQIVNLQQRLGFASSRLINDQQAMLQGYQAGLAVLLEQFKRHNPQARLPLLQHQLRGLNRQLLNAIAAQLRQQQHRLLLQARSLDNLSPLKTLARGYAVITQQQQLVSSVKQLQQDDEIAIEFKDGTGRARVL